MKNQEIAKIFYNMSAYYDMLGIQWKPQAYEKAGRILETSSQDVLEVEDLESLPGIGKAIASKIQEYLKTGKIREYNKLKKQTPVNLEQLIRVEGIGPKRVKLLYKSLNIKNLKDLEKNAKAGKIAKLENFGEKTEKNILKAIEFVKASQGRILLGKALPLAQKIQNKLPAKKITYAGSLRRMQETIGDLDFLAIAKKPKKLINYFVKLPGVKKIWAQGPTKASIRLKAGFDVDLRVIKSESWGSALQYFTGSKEHNIALRRIAISKNLKLSEYGLFRGKKQIAGKTEQEIYKTLGLEYIEPELRENTGELENKLPDLIKYSDIKGDLQMHTNWSDGSVSLENMIKACEKLNYKYIAITDHAGYLAKIQNGLDAKRLLNQMREIDKIKSKLKILKGAEVDITKDGKLAMKDEILSKLDWVVGAVHYNMKMSKNQMTRRLLRVMQNKYINIIAHPTGRILNKRPAYNFDINQVFQEAKKKNIILEINSHMSRLDLKDELIKKAIKFGIKLAINTDSHNISGLNQMHFGIAQARRGWAEKKDIINTKNKFAT